MGNPVNWCIEAWLMGIRLEDPKIELSEGAVLRVLNEEDFDEVQPINVLSLYRPVIPSEVPDAILEIRRRVKLTPYIYPDKERIIFALQLYRPCSLYEMYARWKAEAILQRGGEIARVHLLQPTFRCTLRKEDEDKLQEFIRIIAPRIPLDEKRGVLELRSHLGIALARYQDALLKPEPVANKIAYAVFGLEALYLKGGERQELSRRLAQRISKVVYLLGRTLDPKSVFRDVKRAYEIRSTFVHGNYKELRSRDLLDKIVEYLRISIIAFMQVPVGKSELLDLIDAALIDEQSNEELNELLRKNVITLGG